MSCVRKKNVTLGMAKDLMEDGSYFGTMMVYKGHADGMVSGAAHTTQHTILPALQFIKTKPICGFFDLLCALEDRVSVLGLCNKSKSYCRTTGGNCHFLC
jgi:phosphate acetyltransferase